MAFSGRFTSTLLTQADRLEVAVPTIPQPSAVPLAATVTQVVGSKVRSFLSMCGVVDAEDIAAADAAAAAAAAQAEANAVGVDLLGWPSGLSTAQSSPTRGLGDPNAPSGAFELDGTSSSPSGPGTAGGFCPGGIDGATSGGGSSGGSPGRSPRISVAGLMERQAAEAAARKAAAREVLYRIRRLFLRGLRKGKLLGAMQSAAATLEPMNPQERLFHLLRHYSDELRPEDAIRLANITMATSPDRALGLIPSLAHAFKQSRRDLLDKVKALESLQALDAAMEAERAAQRAEEALEALRGRRDAQGLRPVGSFFPPPSAWEEEGEGAPAGASSSTPGSSSPQPQPLPPFLAQQRRPVVGAPGGEIVPGEAGASVRGYFSRSAALAHTLAAASAHIAEVEGEAGARAHAVVSARESQAAARAAAVGGGGGASGAPCIPTALAPPPLCSHQWCQWQWQWQWQWCAQ